MNRIMAHWLDMVVELLQASTDDLRELALIAGGDPKTFYLGTDLGKLDTEGQDLSGMEFYRPEASSNGTEGSLDSLAEIVAYIKDAPRQEERVARLVDVILQDMVDSGALLDAYGRDRAKIMNYALEKIHMALTDLAESKTELRLDHEKIQTELRIALFARRLISHVYSLNRSRLLYYMAMYLSKYPAVRKVIEENLRKRSSVFYEGDRARIEGLLRNRGREV